MASTSDLCLNEDECLQATRGLKNAYQTVANVPWTSAPPTSFKTEIVQEKYMKWVEVGPIWDNEDAPGKADAWLAKNKGWEWTGNWTTTVETEMSVIQVTKLVDNGTEIYKMTTPKRGIFIIINNINFVSGQPRTGSQIDGDQMKTLFTKLGFEVQCHMDQTADEIRNVFREVSKLNHEEYGAFGCCIMSHGDEGAVCGTDWNLVEIKHLTDELRATLCGKPKFFFIQACRGHHKMKPHDGDEMQDDSWMDEKKELNVPIEADFLYAYSTVPGYVSWRNQTGSWFINAVIKVFNANMHRLDVMNVGRVLTCVNLEVSKNEFDKNTQISSIVSQLRYELYFGPPTS